MTDTASDSVNIIDQGPIRTLELNRPEVHNAFDDQLIRALLAALDAAASDDAVRIIVLTGHGKSFSAGADLNWMRQMASATQETNEADSLQLASLMRKLNFFPKPTIARINGAAFGGGVGLIACCDIAIADKQARMALTEVRLGLVPAVISPYVIDAIGGRQARRLFLTGEPIDANEARRIGLVHQVTESSDLDAAVAAQIDRLLDAGPLAQAAAKALISAVQGGRNEQNQLQMDQATAKLIARLRVSPEGQEGLTAFLEKRDPDWCLTES